MLLISILLLFILSNIALLSILLFSEEFISEFKFKISVSWLPISDWRELILEVNKNFKPPSETKFNLPGNPAKEEMNKVLEKLYNDKVILDHGMKVGKELAYVLSGGDTSIDKTLSEEDLFNLELNAFMRLIETKETQDRIKHTLATGRPLVN